MLVEEGNEKTREVEKIKRFKLAFIFDLYQTEGKELNTYKFDENLFVDDKELDKANQLNDLYDTLIDIKERIEDSKLRKNAIEMKTLSIYN